jgi:hypothetical protein
MQWDEHFETSLLILIEAKPQIAQDQWVFDWLCQMVSSGSSPSRPADDDGCYLINSLRREDLFERASRLSVSGYGADRLTGALALGRVAANVECRAESIQNLLTCRAAEETDVNVLPGLAVAIGSLAKEYRAWCLELLERLLKRDIRIVSHYQANNTFRWLIWQDRPRYEWILEAMAATADDGVTTLGQFWAGHLAVHDSGKWPETEALDASARQVVAALAAGNLRSELAASASIEAAMCLADDDDRDVVSELFDADWKELFDLGGDYIRLAFQLVQSRHFPAHRNRMVLFLDDVAERFPELALEAANRLISATEIMDAEEQRKKNWDYSLGKLVVGVCAGFSERGIDQAPALDLVDRYLELGTHSFESEVQALERRR